jgi:hypothetical protein
MRDGSGNKMSPEEQEKVKSIQGAPDKDALRKTSVTPGTERDSGEADKPRMPREMPPGVKGGA